MRKDKAGSALLRLHPEDNVAVLVRPVEEGEALEIAGQGLSAPASLGIGHKLALCPIAAGEDVLKYGMPIGLATRAIAPGEHVHLHNLHSRYTETKEIEGPTP